MKKLSQIIIIALVLFTAGAAQAEWSALGTGMNNGFSSSEVSAIVVDGFGNVYVGGNFTTAGGVPANNIAKWDPNTSTWSALGSGVNGYVNALAVDGGGTLYAGGGFTIAGGNPANHIAKWDPATSSWSPLGTGMDNDIRSLAFYGGNLYAGGDFTTADGNPVNYIAKFDLGSSTWSALGLGMSNLVNVLAFDDSGNLYVGGNFGTAYNSSGNPVANTDMIAKWDPTTSTWSALGSGMGAPVISIAFDGSGNLYVGGSFNSTPKYIAKFDPTTSTWISLGSGMNGNVLKLLCDGSNLYAGGWFTNAYDSSGNPVANTGYIAKWDLTTSTWSALGSEITDTVISFAFDGPGDLYVGGQFSILDGSSTNYIAKWTQPPYAFFVSSTAADGTYGIGASIPIDVTFSRAVNVTGTPQLTLETGTTDAVLNYASGSGTNTLTFNYTVASGHTSADLDYLSSSSLALNGGTIKSPSGIDAAVLTLPAPGAGDSLGFNKDIIIDAVAPTITSITSTTADGTYGPGSTVNVYLKSS